MVYQFYCANCDKELDVEIPMELYDKEKTNQTCPVCKGPIRRCIRWNGSATGYGDGWFGKSNGGTTI